MNCNSVHVDVSGTTNCNSAHDDVSDILAFACTLHRHGYIPKEQVDAIEDFKEGKIDYGMMRSMCG